jgi:predicted nucleic acid-binding protein
VSLVIDASLTLSWYFEDERTSEADAVLDQLTETGAVVPVLWHLEVANGFQMAIRRKRIDTHFRDRAIRQLAILPITVDTETGASAWTTTLALADRFELTIYDACYLELAQRREMPLATLDQDLRDAGRALGLLLLGLAGQ